jgi:hypothetical protein
LPGSYGTSIDLDRQLDRAIGQSLFSNAVPALASFEFGLLRGVGLKKLIELGLIAPAAAVVIELGWPVETSQTTGYAGKLDGFTGKQLTVF